MQTREPGKRVNWIFVIILIIVIPLIVFILYMMNAIPTDNPSNKQVIDSSEVDNKDTLDLQNQE